MRTPKENRVFSTRQAGGISIFPAASRDDGPVVRDLSEKCRFRPSLIPCEKKIEGGSADVPPHGYSAGQMKRISIRSPASGNLATCRFLTSSGFFNTLKRAYGIDLAPGSHCGKWGIFGAFDRRPAVRRHHWRPDTRDCDWGKLSLVGFAAPCRVLRRPDRHGTRLQRSASRVGKGFRIVRFCR